MAYHSGNVREVGNMGEQSGTVEVRQDQHRCNGMMSTRWAKKEQRKSIKLHINILHIVTLVRVFLWSLPLQMGDLYIVY